MKQELLQNKTESKTLGEFVDLAKEKLFEIDDKEEREASIQQILLFIELDLRGVHND